MCEQKRRRWELELYFYTVCVFMWPCVCQDVIGSHRLLCSSFSQMSLSMVHLGHCKFTDVCVRCICLSVVQLTAKRKVPLTCCNQLLAFNRSLKCLTVLNRDLVMWNTRTHTPFFHSMVYCSKWQNGLCFKCYHTRERENNFKQQHDIQQHIIHL